MPVATATAPATKTAVSYLDMHETHTGVVVLAGNRAYKAKKAVRTTSSTFAHRSSGNARVIGKSS